MTINPELTCSDIIAFLGLIVGIWIAITVNKKLTTTRSIKDFHIDELKNIKNLYSEFLNNVMADNISAIDIQTWFKQMSYRIKVFEDSISEYYNFGDKKFRFSPEHNYLKIYLTGTDDFNNTYNQKTIKLSSKTKDQLFNANSNVVKKMMSTAVYINTSNKKICYLISRFRNH